MMSFNAALIRESVPEWFWIGTVFVFGSVVGSFLNVCIHRMPRGHSTVAPRSRCYSCEHTIRWYDNIPLLSYLLLGGKCRDCGARFSIRYWLVELFTALLFVGLWWRFVPMESGLSKFFVYALFSSGLIAATFIDIEHLIISALFKSGGRCRP